MAREALASASSRNKKTDELSYKKSSWILNFLLHQAEVITWAVANLEDAFKREGYPPGWRIPRWDSRSPQEPARAKQTTARRVRAR
jgi:hypothetical protein